MKRRGWVEFYPHEGGWLVYDWSEHHYSGYEIGFAADRSQAIRMPQEWAEQHGRKLAVAVDP